MTASQQHPAIIVFLALLLSSRCLVCRSPQASVSGPPPAQPACGRDSKLLSASSTGVQLGKRMIYEQEGMTDTL